MSASNSADRYLEPNQARTRPQTPYEDLLGDAVERAFGAGIDTLPALVARLNETGPSAENGQPWTEASFQAAMARLGA
jgi:hypothetical protein